MPQFKYEAKRGPSSVDSGVIQAESRRAAVARLREMGFLPISVEEDTGKDKPGMSVRALLPVSLKERNVFFRQLATLFDSGMPLTRCLTTLAEQSGNPKLTRVIEQLREDVEKGSTFAEALERHPDLFPAMYCSLVRAGESGGMLEEVLWRIVAYGERDEELRGTVINALVYPAFLMFMGSVAIFILVSFVFPKFETVFGDFQQGLPWMTQVVMAVCKFMGRFWWAVLLVLAGLIGGLVAWARSEAGRLQLDTAVLRVPVVRAVATKYTMGQFARTLGTLLDNGVPILTSLRITVDTLSNRAIAGQIQAVEERVAEGGSVSSGLAESEFFPPMVVNMFSVGEESGRIGEVTTRMADAYDIEVDRAVKAMTALLEPLLIVVMAVIVGFLVIAMLLPILTMSATAI